MRSCKRISKLPSELWRQNMAVEISTVEMQVPGLCCLECSQGVDQALRRTPGVHNLGVFASPPETVHSASIRLLAERVSLSRSFSFLRCEWYNGWRSIAAVHRFSRSRRAPRNAKRYQD